MPLEKRYVSITGLKGKKRSDTKVHKLECMMEKKNHLTRAFERIYMVYKKTLSEGSKERSVEKFISAEGNHAHGIDLYLRKKRNTYHVKKPALYLALWVVYYAQWNHNCAERLNA